MGMACDASAQVEKFPCGADVMASGRVATIHDGRSFALADGREIRIAALQVPLLAPGGRTPAAGSAARQALNSIIADEAVELRAAGDAADRYGRTVAHVYLAGASDGRERSVQRTLLARGFARVTADLDDGACTADLLSQERAARRAKLGLWADPIYAILDARSRAELVARRGHFALAEGKVVSVRTSGATIYVNFGRQWSQALTLTISKRRERMFVQAGLVPKGLENRRIRVRGWVELRTGPQIEAKRPEQIEIAELN